MQALRTIRRCFRFKDSAQLTHKLFVSFDGIVAIFCLLILVFSDNRSSCLASFYLFWSLYFLGQTISHYLLMKMPKIDVVKFSVSIKRLIGIICFIEVVYLLLVIVFWQKSHIHPIYCAVCEQYQWPYSIGIIFIFHFVISAGIVISLIHLFVSRKYYLIALGGFQVQQRLALERETALRRIGLIQPNFDYPIDASAKSNKYYKFQDVIQPGVINEEICSICLNRKVSGENIIKTKCNHFYHRSCVQKWASVDSRCPDCRTSFDRDFTQRKPIQVQISTDTQRSRNLQVIYQENRDDEIKDDEIKDDEIKDDEIKDDEIKDDEIKDDE